MSRLVVKISSLQRNDARLTSVSLGPDQFDFVIFRMEKPRFGMAGHSWTQICIDSSPKKSSFTCPPRRSERIRWWRMGTSSSAVVYRGAVGGRKKKAASGRSKPGYAGPHEQVRILSINEQSRPFECFIYNPTFRSHDRMRRRRAEWTPWRARSSSFLSGSGPWRRGPTPCVSTTSLCTASQAALMALQPLCACAALLAAGRRNIAQRPLPATAHTTPARAHSGAAYRELAEDLWRTAHFDGSAPPPAEGPAAAAAAAAAADGFDGRIYFDLYEAFNRSRIDLRARVTEWYITGWCIIPEQLNNH